MVAVVSLGAVAAVVVFQAGEVWELDIATPAPVARYETAGAAVAGRLYLFGGFDEQLVARRETYKFVCNPQVEAMLRVALLASPGEASPRASSPLALRMALEDAATSTSGNGLWKSTSNSTTMESPIRQIVMALRRDRRIWGCFGPTPMVRRN